MALLIVNFCTQAQANSNAVSFAVRCLPCLRMSRSFLQDPLFLSDRAMLSSLTQLNGKSADKCYCCLHSKPFFLPNDVSSTLSVLRDISGGSSDSF